MKTVREICRTCYHCRYRHGGEGTVAVGFLNNHRGSGIVIFGDGAVSLQLRWTSMVCRAPVEFRQEKSQLKKYLHTLSI